MNQWAIAAIGGAVIWLAMVGLVTTGFIIATVIKKTRADSRRKNQAQEELRKAVISGVLNELKRSTQKGGGPRGPVAS